MAGQDIDDEEADYDAKVREEADVRLGQVVGGKYKILRALGVGGMGAVYEVEHQLIGKRMALKCLHAEYARDRDLIERFKREARAATAIGNEHIVDVTDMGDLPDGAPFLVMEMLKGQALADLLDKEGALPIGRSCRIVRQICFALEAAHDKGIVHRDMKPENVFLAARSETNDFVKVLDFGISKMHEHGKTDRGLTRTGIAMGTPSYMSPEQAQGAKDVDHRTDIWAVGVMLYEMLTLRRPFEAESYPMMLMAIVGRDPEPMRVHRKDVPQELELVVMRTLAKPVGLRTQTMRELADALQPFVNVEGKPQLIEDGGGSKQSAPRSTKVAKSRKSAPASDPPPQARDQSPPKSETLMAGGSEPPPAGQAASQTARTPAPATRASPPSQAPDAPSEPSRPSASTQELGSVERRASASTGEIGTVERRGREPTSSGASPTVGGRGPLYAAAGALALVAVGVAAWVTSGPGATAEPPAVPAPTPEPPSGTSAPEPPPEPPPSVPVVPTATEVAIQITTTPADAHIEIAGVEFPNPLNAHRPRSLDPITIRIAAEGYETVERLAIFDHDQSFVFQLARGRGVRREGMDGRVREPDHGGHTTGGTGAATGGTAGTGEPAGDPGGFREEW